jgi:hypothetical protein
MSRCRACDSNLTDYEATRKYQGTKTYIDLCNYCFQSLYIQADDRPDLPDVSTNLEEEHHDTNITDNGTI